MINLLFKNIIDNHLGPYIGKKVELFTPGDPTLDRLVVGNISQIGDPSHDVLKNNVIMSLVNIEEDRISRSPDNFVRFNNQMVLSKPPVYINLYVLFASYYDADKYEAGLQMIAWVIQFFQFLNVFNRANSPKMPNGVEELIFDLKSLSFQDLNNLWGVLGSKYMPSVLYKVRMLTINEPITLGEMPLIQGIQVNDKAGGIYG